MNWVVTAFGLGLGLSALGLETLAGSFGSGLDGVRLLLELLILPSIMVFSAGLAMQREPGAETLHYPRSDLSP
jgi:hypothetical protein